MDKHRGKLGFVSRLATASAESRLTTERDNIEHGRTGEKKISGSRRPIEIFGDEVLRSQSLH